MVFVGALVAAAGTAYAANRQASAANKATKAQKDAAGNQLAFQREQFDWNKDRYNEWHGMFMPVLEDIKNEAYADKGPDYTGIAGDVGTAFDASQQINQRQMERYGVTPTDGAMQAANTAYGVGRASAHVDARNRARMAHTDQRWNRLNALWGQGQGMMSSAAGGTNNAGNAVGDAYGAQAAQAGARAAQHGQAAGALMGQSMQYIGGMFGYGENAVQDDTPFRRG